MTNEEIIYKESVKLMKQGVLKVAGQVDYIDTATGETTKVDMPECIHTFKGWNDLGYKVKKGEHAKAKFAIWTLAKKKEQDEDDKEAVANPTMYLHTAYWFTLEQVERRERD